MPGAALPMMGITAGAQGAYEAGRGGKSLDGQAVFGFVSGAIEILTEKLPLGRILSAWETGGESGVWRFARAFFRGALPEAGEEFVNTVAGNVAERILDQDAAALRSRAFWKSTLSAALYSAAQGILAGGLAAGVPAAANAPGTYTHPDGTVVALPREAQDAPGTYTRPDGTTIALPREGEGNFALTSPLKDASMKVDADPFSEGAGDYAGILNPPKPLSLSNTETRRWYLDAEAQIPDLIDRTKPLEQQARQASALRNQIRTQAREAMTNRELANTLFASKPNMTWEEVVDKYSKLGLSGDELYEEIIRAAIRSNPQVNELLNTFPE